MRKLFVITFALMSLFSTYASAKKVFLPLSQKKCKKKQVKCLDKVWLEYSIDVNKARYAKNRCVLRSCNRRDQTAAQRRSCVERCEAQEFQKQLRLAKILKKRIAICNTTFLMCLTKSFRR